MKIFSTLRQHPIVSGIAAIVVATVSIAGAMSAWGPERTTFTMENPADYPVFNSITDNPTYGDERNFVTINDITANTGFKSSVDLVQGHTYKVQIYIHNDAKSRLNESGAGIALDTTVTAFMPSVVNGSADASATVAASNTNPLKVWDNAVMKSSERVELEYVSGSAILSNHQQQTKLSDNLLTSGVKVGSYDLSGKWYACHDYAGAVTFEFKVKENPTSDFTMSKQVRKHSTTSGGWVESYAAQPGETVDYLVQYKNTGNVTQENVVIKDTLPAGMTYVAGSTILANGNNPSGKAINDDVTTKGVNIGTYAPGASAWVRFSAKVADSDDLVCGANSLKNVASVTTGSGTKSDDAIVTVDKECTQPVYRCDLLTIDKVSRDSFKFSVKYTTSDGATYKGTTYKVYDANGKEVYNSSNGTFNGFAAGTYTVKAFVTVTVNGSDQTVTSEACAGQFTIQPEEKPSIKIEKLVDGVNQKTVNTNQEFTYQIKVTNTGNVDLKDAKVTDNQPSGVTFLSASEGTISNGVWTTTIATLKVGESKSFTIKAKVPTYKAGTIKNTVCVDTPTIPNNEGSDSDDCDDANIDVPKPEQEKVCELDTKTIITIDKDKFDSNKHSRDLSDCAETPTKIKVCELDTKKVITINESDFDSSKHSNNLSDCAEEEETDIEVCRTDDKTIVTIKESEFDSSKYSKTLSDCDETPVTPTTPTELPKTGIEGFGIIGVGALGYAGYAYTVSRRINR